MLSLAALRTALGTTPVRTRFAPSVTGHLHLGHAVNAVYVWGIAQALRGEVLIRLEDHDEGRFRLAYERSILDDLEWLGLRSALPIAKQREHQNRYAIAAQELLETGHTFHCDCTRKTLAAEGRDSGPADSETVRYLGKCRSRALGPGPGRAIRLRVEPGAERFDDLRLGPVTQDPAAQCGDFVLHDGQGQWTYQHCVVADDIAEGITLVIRGEDILESTGRQLRLMRLLSHPTPPRYLHHPLVTDATGKKLSKKEFAKSLGDLRKEGWTPERVLGEAAFLGGLTPESKTVSASDLATLFK